MDKALEKTYIDNLVNFNNNISVNNIDKKEIMKEFSRIIRDNPLLFHIENFSLKYDAIHRSGVISPTYNISKQEYNQLIQKLLAKINVIYADLLKLKSNYERAKYIHDYICKNVTYEDFGPNAHNIIGPLLMGKGVCDGISKAVLELLICIRIPAHLIVGEGKNGNNQNYESHAWNVVNIDGDWFNLDCTFDLTISSDRIRYDYFLINKDAILKDHKWEPEYSQLVELCINDENYYELNNMSFYTVIEAQKYIKECIDKNMSNFIFQIKKDYISLDNEIIIKYLKAIIKNGSFRTNINVKQNVYETTITNISTVGKRIFNLFK